MGHARHTGHYFFVAILTSLATWVVPVGMFDSQEVQYLVDGQTKTRKVVDPHSFRILTNDAGDWWCIRHRNAHRNRVIWLG